MNLKKVFFITVLSSTILSVLAENQTQDINQILGLLKSDPMCSMAHVREYVCNNIDSLTMEQRSMLVVQLTNVERGCNLNELEMYRTWSFWIASLLGFKAAFSLGRASTAQQLESSIKHGFYVTGLQERVLGDVALFCLALVVTYIMEARYQISTRKFSIKEDCMKAVINDTINMLMAKKVAYSMHK